MAGGSGCGRAHWKERSQTDPSTHMTSSGSRLVQVQGAVMSQEAFLSRLQFAHLTYMYLGFAVLLFLNLCNSELGRRP